MSILQLLRLGFRWNRIAVVVFALLGSVATPQNSQPAAPATPPAAAEKSIATAVRDSKAQKTSRAKKVFTDDDLEPIAGPLPRLKMDGAENSEDIIAAIAQYKKNHTPEQTEDAVRRWYEKYDEELAAAIQENLDVKTLRDANMTNGYELCQESQDYEHCANRQMAEQRGARHDQVAMNNNVNLMVRVQHSFMKIRNGLAQNSLHYEWFKIRTTNNIDRF